MARRMDAKRIRESGVGPHGESHAAGRNATSTIPANGMAEETVATIVAYTDQEPPRNLYPQRIVSPVRSGPCCFTGIEEVGEPQEDRRWVFQYKRCTKCGFALRVILREIPDAALAAELRTLLANAFVRNVPEYD